MDTIEGAFRAIDQAQKIEFQAQSYLVATELFVWFAVPGLLALIAAAALARPFGGLRNLGAAATMATSTGEAVPVRS